MTYVWRFHDLSGILGPFRLAALTTVASWGFLVFEPRIPVLKRVVTTPFILLFLLFLVWAAVGQIFGLDPANSWDELVGIQSKNVTMMLFIATTIVSMKNLRVALLANAFGAAVLAFYYIKSGTPTWGSPVPMYDRNDLALLLNSAIPIALWFVATTRNRRVRWGFIALAVACAYSVLMGQSRGGFLTLSTVVIFLLFAAKGVPVWKRALPLVLTAVGLLFLPAQVTDRLSTLLSPEDDYNVESPTGRLQVWERGLGYAMDFPIFGVGIGNFSEAERTIPVESRMFAGKWKASVAHNTYVEVLAETGFPGAILFLAMLIAAFVRLIRTRSRLKRVGGRRAEELRALADMLALSLVGFCIGVTFLSTLYSSILVGILGLLAGFVYVADNHCRAAGRRGVRLRRRRGPRALVS